MNDSQQVFFLASSKPWNYSIFEDLQSYQHEKWIWIDNPDSLDEQLKLYKPCKIFFAHWNWKVSNSIIEEIDCICFHMTDLPYGRGGSPLQNLIIEGNAKTKMSALRMTAEIDGGPIYAKKDLDLHGSARSIFYRARKLIYELIVSIIEDELQPVSQHGEVTMFKRRTPDMSALQNIKTLNGLYDHIRMLDAPTYPLAFLEVGAFRFEFSDAEIDGECISAKVNIIEKKK